MLASGPGPVGHSGDLQALLCLSSCLVLRRICWVHNGDVHRVSQRLASTLTRASPSQLSRPWRKIRQGPELLGVSSFQDRVIKQGDNPSRELGGGLPLPQGLGLSLSVGGLLLLLASLLGLCRFLPPYCIGKERQILQLRPAGILGPGYFQSLKLKPVHAVCFSRHLIRLSLHKDLASCLEADTMLQGGELGPGVFLHIGFCGEQNCLHWSQFRVSPLGEEEGREVSRLSLLV